MTASGLCAICKKPTPIFRYNSPRKDPNNINDGQWLCDEHDTQHAKDRMRDIETLGGISMRATKRAKAKEARRKKLW